MSITGASLIAPVGELPSSLLAEVAGARVPAETDVSAVASGYATVANLKTLAWATGTTSARDAGAAAWCYFMAYHERAGQIAAGFANATAAGEGGVGYTMAQAQWLEAQATRWQQAYDALAPADALDPAPAPLASRQIITRFAW